MDENVDDGLVCLYEHQMMVESTLLLPFGFLIVSKATSINVCEFLYHSSFLYLSSLAIPTSMIWLSFCLWDNL